MIPIYRNGKLEDVYWTFSYSPVNDEKGEVSGVLVTCSETTDKVITRKKLEESKEQLQFAIEAAELGTWDYNPATGKFTANNRLKEWFGLSSDAEIELSYAINAIAEKDRQKVTDAIENALEFSSGGHFEIEYSIIHPRTKKETIVQAKGQAQFTNNHIAYRLNGTLQDITRATTSHRKTEESEKEFRQLADSLPELVWTTDNKGKQAFASRRWKEFTGLDPYDETTFGKMVHPDDLENIVKVWTQLFSFRRYL
ncbi:MAG: PAS domain-containing protein [Bacteroidota bacterium]